jgi:hypothetical protein
LDKLREARKRTSCQRFKDSLDAKIAKVQGKLEGPCPGFAEQLAGQAGEVRRLVKHYEGIRRSGPGSPLDVMGPNACRAVSAAELLELIRREARDAGCAEATRFQDPMGIWAAELRGTCRRWKDEQEPPPDEPERDRDEPSVSCMDGLCRLWRQQALEWERFRMSPSACEAAKREKARMQADLQRLAGEFSRLERDRAPLVQQRAVACAFLRKLRETNELGRNAHNRGCETTGLSIWYSNRIKGLCPGMPASTSESPQCAGLIEEALELLGKAAMGIAAMQDLKSSGGDPQAMERLACDVSAASRKLSQKLEEARRAGCRAGIRLRVDEYLDLFCTDR